MKTEELDLRTATCPGPLVETALKLKRMEVGGVLRVLLSTSLNSDLEDFIKRKGYQLLLKENENQYIVFVIKKTLI